MGRSVRGLHPAFRITRDDYWYWNRYRLQKDGGANLKARVCFSYPVLLNNLNQTELLAKIGPNRDKSSPYRYVGFIYGKDTDRAAVELCAKKFPYAELILGLDRNAGTLPDAERIQLIP